MKTSRKTSHNSSRRRAEAASKRDRRPTPSAKPAEPANAPNAPTRPPVLRFTPTAWAKLIYFRDRGPTEIGGFAVTDPADPLRIVDFATVKQKVSPVSVSFDDDAVADFFEDQVDAGRHPAQFMRIWAHTHPGDCPEPSGTDEDTFARVFGQCDWAVMFIVAKRGQTYARLRFNVGPAGQMLIPVEVDYDAPFAASDEAAWEAEYQANVEVESSVAALPQVEAFEQHDDLLGLDLDPTLDEDAMRMLMGADADDFAYPHEEEIDI